MSWASVTIALVEYQALYRKYRPQRFSEVIGQDHVTQTLTREVEEEKVAHAYLFAGPRGTGKTSTARILAKVLNCPNKTPEGEPCGICPICEGIAGGSSLDVIELDAASHNKVEDIRDLRVGVSTVASVGGGRRVFILDEAHMLSKAAGNALLKTLEEPPEHVHFVLATTEPYKLLDTVRSRAQRFDFHPVAVEEIAGFLEKVAASEGYLAAPAALSAIARHASGSVRDSLSLLEQVAALGAGAVDLVGVRRALGLADREAYQRLASAIVDQDAKAGLELVAALAGDGADLRRFVAEAIAFFRGVFLTHYTQNIEEIADEPSDVVEEWTKTAAQMPASDVLRTVDELTETLIRLREGREERLMLEMAVLKLTRPEVGVDLGSLLARVDRLDEHVRRLGSGARLATEQPPARQAPQQAREDAVQTTPAPEEIQPMPVDTDQEHDLPPVEDLTVEQVEAVWPILFSSVRDELGPRHQAFFREARPGVVRGSTIVLHLPPHLDFHLEQLRSSDEVAAAVGAKASELLGGRVEIEFESGSEMPADEEESTRAPDKDSLAEATSESLDPERLVEDLLGGRVVEDTTGT